MAYTTIEQTKAGLSRLKDYADEGLAKKQDRLVSGTNIKTVNGESLLGSGNLELGGGGASSAQFVVETYDEQTGAYTLADGKTWDDVANAIRDKKQIRLVTSHTDEGDWVYDIYDLVRVFEWTDGEIIHEAVFTNERTMLYESGEKYNTIRTSGDIITLTKDKLTTPPYGDKLITEVLAVKPSAIEDLASMTLESNSLFLGTAYDKSGYQGFERSATMTKSDNGVELTMAEFGESTLETELASVEYVNGRSYTKAETDEKITEELGKFEHLDYKIVDTLPTTGDAGVRYLVKHPTDARYEEYIYVSDAWHDIGSTSDVSLSNYYTKAEADALIAERVKTDVPENAVFTDTVYDDAALAAAIADRYTKAEADALLGEKASVKENAGNNDEVYKLDITDGEGTITTPNLIGGGGTLVAGEGISITGNEISVTNATRPEVEAVVSDAFSSPGAVELAKSGYVGNHSTDERRVGTWIDGKPVYQRTVVAKTPSSTGRNSEIVSTASWDIDKVVSFSGSFWGGSSAWLPINYYYAPNNYAMTHINDSNQLTMIIGFNGHANQDTYITVTYTKATDGGT